MEDNLRTSKPTCTLIYYYAFKHRTECHATEPDFYIEDLILVRQVLLRVFDIGPRGAKGRGFPIDFFGGRNTVIRK